MNDDPNQNQEKSGQQDASGATSQPQQPQQQPPQPQQQQPPQQQPYQQPPQQQPQQPPQQGAAGAPPQEKKSHKGCLIGCLIVLVVVVLILAGIGIFLRTQGDNIMRWGLDRIFGESSDLIEDIFDPDEGQGDLDVQEPDEEDPDDAMMQPTDDPADEDPDDPVTDEPDETTQPPLPDDEGGEDIEGLDRYPGAVMTEQSRFSFDESVQEYRLYLVESDIDSVVAYYDNLIGDDWEEKSNMSMNEDHTIIGYRSVNGQSEQVTIGISPSSSHDGHVEIHVYALNVSE